MNHTEFFDQLKNGLPSGAYLFHGDEEFVKESAYRALLNAAVVENPDFNLTTIDTDSAQEIISACETLPFMSERRMVVLRRLPVDKDGRAIADYIERIPRETVLLFLIKGKADGKTALVKRMKSIGRDVEFNTLDDNEIIRWLISNAKKGGCALSRENAQYILTLTGHDMLNVSNELKKLIAYCNYKDEISYDTIDRMVTRNPEYKLFSMFDAFMKGDLHDGFHMLDSILGSKRDEEALSVSGYLLGCFKNMLSVSDLMHTGMSKNDIMKRLNMRDYTLRSTERNLKSRSREWLLDAVARLSDIVYLRVSGERDAEAALKDSLSAIFSPV